MDDNPRQDGDDVATGPTVGSGLPEDRGVAADGGDAFAFPDAVLGEDLDDPVGIVGIVADVAVLRFEPLDRLDVLQLDDSPLEFLRVHGPCLGGLPYTRPGHRVERRGPRAMVIPLGKRCQSRPNAVGPSAPRRRRGSSLRTTNPYGLASMIGADGLVRLCR